MIATAVRPILSRMLADVSLAVRASLTDRPGQVAGALSRYAADPALLIGQECPSAAERYARHLLAEDGQSAYAVAALVWRPGQMSRVHSHQTWCALGVHSGVLTETFYLRASDDGAPQTSEIVLRWPGDTSHGAADPNLIHRIANLGTHDAISIHVYGVAFDQFSTSVNRVLAA